MMVRRFLVMLSFALNAAPAWADLTPDQERQIREAAPKIATVVPKRPRHVLIWNTPHMEKSPHKGFTIPQGAFAMQVLGEKTGAFEAVIGDDQTLLLPQNLKRFDAMVMNNSCGPWTRCFSTWSPTRVVTTVPSPVQVPSTQKYAVSRNLRRARIVITVDRKCGILSVFRLSPYQLTNPTGLFMELCPISLVCFGRNDPA